MVSLEAGLMDTRRVGTWEGKAVHVGGLGDRCDGRTCGSAFLIASVVLAK